MSKKEKDPREHSYDGNKHVIRLSAMIEFLEKMKEEHGDIQLWRKRPHWGKGVVPMYKANFPEVRELILQRGNESTHNLKKEGSDREVDIKVCFFHNF